MHRARLAEEAAAKQLENAIGLDKDPPKAMGRGGVVSAVGAVLREADRLGHFVRHLVDRHADVKLVQEVHGSAIEVRNRLRREGERALLAPAGAGDEAVADEVELDLEEFGADRDRRRG